MSVFVVDYLLLELNRMAKWVSIGNAVNRSEIKAFNYFRENLPDFYVFYTNITLTDTSGHLWDYDTVLLGKHAVYVIEIKNYGGTIRGDRYHWVLSDPTFTPPGDILTTVDVKAKAKWAKWACFRLSNGPVLG